MDTLRDGLAGVGVWCGGLRWGDKGEAVEVAAELDELGYKALWIPDTGGDVYGAVDRLMAATKRAIIATGILNLWRHGATEAAAEHARLVAEHGDRFMVGIGVSHHVVVDREGEKVYRQPLKAMADYLDELDAAPIPLAPRTRALAALGPKMLKLASERTAGVHPYNVTPEHTAIAHEILGDEGMVMPEQTVALTTDPTRARALGRAYVEGYFRMPNYVNNWRRLGFNDDDFADGGSDRLIDRLVAWGDEAAIAKRVHEHFDAGAHHVCIQVLTEEGFFPRAEWRALASALLS